MGINIGNKELKEAFLGGKPVSEIYLGNTKIWPVSTGNTVDLMAPDKIYFKVTVKDPTEKFKVAVARYFVTPSYNWKIQVDDGPVIVKQGTHHNPCWIDVPLGEHTVTISPNGPAVRGWAGIMGYNGRNTDINKLEFYMMNLPMDAFRKNLANPTHAGARLFQNCKTVTKTPSVIIDDPLVTSMENHYAYGMFWGATNLTEMQEGFAFPQHYTSVGGYVATYMFKDCTKLTALSTQFSIPPNIQSDTGEYNLAGIFNGCTGLTSNAPSQPFVVPAKAPPTHWSYGTSNFVGVGNGIPPNPPVGTPVDIKRNAI